MAEGLELAILELTKTLQQSLDLIVLVRSIEKTQIQMEAHLAVINREYGEMRDAQVAIGERLDRGKEREDVLRNGISVLQTDVDWLKRFFWIVAGAAITGAIGSIISVVLNVLTRLNGS